MKTKQIPAPERAGNAKAVALADKAIEELGDRPDDLLLVVLFVEALSRRNRRTNRGN